MAEVDFTPTKFIELNSGLLAFIGHALGIPVFSLESKTVIDLILTDRAPYDIACNESRTKIFVTTGNGNEVLQYDGELKFIGKYGGRSFFGEQFLSCCVQSGALYICDYNNGQIQVFTEEMVWRYSEYLYERQPRAIAANGNVLLVSVYKASNPTYSAIMVFTLANRKIKHTVETYHTYTIDVLDSLFYLCLQKSHSIYCLFDQKGNKTYRQIEIPFLAEEEPAGVARFVHLSSGDIAMSTSWGNKIAVF